MDISDKTVSKKSLGEIPVESDLIYLDQLNQHAQAERMVFARNELAKIWIGSAGPRVFQPVGGLGQEGPIRLV